MRERLDAVSPGAFRAGVLLHTGPQHVKIGDRLFMAPIDTLWHHPPPRGLSRMAKPWPERLRRVSR